MRCFRDVVHRHGEWIMYKDTSNARHGTSHGGRGRILGCRGGVGAAVTRCHVCSITNRSSSGSWRWRWFHHVASGQPRACLCTSRRSSIEPNNPRASGCRLARADGERGCCESRNPSITMLCHQRQRDQVVVELRGVFRSRRLPVSRRR